MIDEDEYEEFEEDEPEEVQQAHYIYDTTSSPYLGPDNQILVDVLGFNESGNMFSLSIILPSMDAANEFMKYFRTNADPMTGEDVNKFIERHRRRMIH